MNERIRELIIQTDEWLENNAQSNRYEREIKFAELIVRECIDVGIKDFYNHLPNIFPANAIKKHFGVEE